MNWRQITIYFCVLALIIILGYDAFACFKGGNYATISGLFWSLSKTYPMVPFLLGVLVGHLCWQVTNEESTK